MSGTKSILGFGLAVLVIALAAPTQAQVVCYVDHHRPNDSGDGFSWGAAKKTIQGAVDISAPALCDQVWVAKGTYVQASPLLIDSRTPDIYGGFDVGDIQLSQRDWVANETIIDGNDAIKHVIVIQNAAAPIIDGFTITGGTAWTGILDVGGGIHMSHCGGLVPEIRNNFIRDNGNYLYGHGGGIYVWNCSPVISNNIFQDNLTFYLGHHIDLETSWATITNNTFLGNFSIDNSDSSPTISNNIFWGGTTTNSKITNDAFSFPIVQYNDIQQPGYGDGSGGPDADGNINLDPLLFGFRPHLRAGSPAIDAGTNDAAGLPTTDFEKDSRIIDGDENGTATVDMGADEFEPGQAFGIWYVDGGVATTGSGTSWSDPMQTIHEALTGALDGDEIWVRAGTYPFTTSATRSGVDVGVYGGFAGGETQRDQRDPSANETILDGQGTSGTLNVTSGTVDSLTFTRSTGHSAGTISHCKFIANPSWVSGGIVRNSRFEGNTGGAALASTIEDSVFIGNTRSGGSGGAIIAGSSTTVDRCRFFNNSAGVRGGAIYVGSGANIDVRNSLFVGNHAGADDSWEGGGAIWTYNSSISVTNSTFYGNYTENSGMGGAIGSFFNETTYTVINSVFWDNVANNNSWSNNLRGTPTVTYSDLDETRSGAGNINADPLFTDPDGDDDVLGTEDDDLRLGASSPAADAGNNASIDPCSTDLDRTQRFLDDPDVTDTGNGTAPIIDMGAYERGGSATEYTLTMAVTGTGTTDPAVGAHDYPVCSVVTIGATPGSGWTFANWTGDAAEPSSATTTVTMMADRSATANFIQPSSADCSITKSNHQEGVTIGSSITYTLVVSNAGPSSVTNAPVQDSVPADLTCSWTCVPSAGAACTASPPGSDLSDLADLAAGSSVTYTGKCDVSAGASGTLENTATVTVAGGGTDPVPGNNSSTDTDTLSSAPPTTREVFGEESGTETYEAQTTITVSHFVVKSGAVVTLRAGQAVILGEGLVVENGATLILEIDPTLAP